jgi:hypothetical protein
MCDFVTRQGKCHRSFFADDEERAFLGPEGGKDAKKTVVLDRVVKEERTVAEESAALAGLPLRRFSPFA